MREQTIVWRNDFENIEFGEKIERAISKHAIIYTTHGCEAVGFFVLCKDGIYFEACSGMCLPSSRIREFAFLE